MDFKEKVKKIIEEIRPQLQADGGDIDLVEADMKTGIVKVSLAGKCRYCPMASFTLERLVEKRLKDEIKEVKEVINVLLPE
jgi:Fe-S cluster biogenesis protein NfuA